ncbi:MAG: SH3 domain-containing protein, partial [Syntrophales bacterium]|nr:SH3 domain-containing protein [Syntrophales bacterium]
TALPQNGATLAALLKEGGFQGVIIKGWQGTQRYKVFNWTTLKWEINLNRELIAPLQAAGLKVMSYSFYEGSAPESEGILAAQLCNELGLDGHVWDVEWNDDLFGAEILIKRMLSAFRDRSNVPMAYCSWPYYDHAHSIAPARVAMELCDAAIPMVYWFEKDPAKMCQAAVDILERSLAEWKTITDKPIVPAGRAYKENGYTASVDSILAFDERAREMGVPGLSWWFLDHAQPAKQPAWWSALKSTQPFDGQEIPIPPQPEPIPVPIPEYSQYKVVQGLINVRKEAGQSSALVGTLAKNTVISVDIPTPINGYVHYVGLESGGPPKGWVWAGYLLLVSVSPSQYAQYKVVPPLINVRKEAAQSSTWVGTLVRNTVISVDIPAPANGYVHYADLKSGGPKEGWVWKDYLIEA